MDRNIARDIFLTKFKPKEKNIDTPYLGELDGHLKLVGLSGKQNLILEQQASDEVIAQDGTATSKFNPARYTELAIQACLRLRETGEHLLNLADVPTFLDELDNDVSKPLIKEILALVGKKNATLEEKKANSEETSDGSSTSSLQPDSVELSANSSTESTPAS